MNQLAIASLHCLAFQGGSPLSHYSVILLLIGAYFLIDGTCAIVAGIKFHSAYKRGWLLIVDGILRLIFVLTFIALSGIPPGMLSLMLIVVGIIEIVAAIRLRKYVNGIAFFACVGIASVLFLPSVIAALYLRLELDFPHVFGGYMIIFGALMLVFGLRMKARGRPTLQH